MLPDPGTALAALPGIGPRRAEVLAKGGLRTVEDLLWRLPFRFEDRSRLQAVAELEPDVKATVRVEVVRCRQVPIRRRGLTLIEAEVKDQTGRLKAVFFNQPYQREALVAGAPVLLYGAPVKKGLFLELQNPEVEPLSGDDGEAIHTGRVVPVYERIGTLGPRAHRALVHRLLGQVSGSVPEILPEGVCRDEGLLAREAAFREAHFPLEAPAGGSEPPPALRRLAFEELFIDQLGLAARRRRIEQAGGAPILAVDDAMRERLRGAVPFALTGAQRRVLKEVVADLGSERPMRRLLQGDVGSGKTVVAALAMAVAAMNGTQAAMMAPTELLAEQHDRTLAGLLGRAGLRPLLLTGSLRAAERRERLRALAAGEASIAVGTHALIQKGVKFARLGLVVVDEQHRFGVVQREALGAKGHLHPHMLIMTATPIPRSLALTVYGDLSLSVIDELPPGRLKPRTVIKTDASEAESYGFLRQALERGAQAYVVCPLIEESEASDLKAAEAWAEYAATQYLRGFSVGLIHGRMKPQERIALMERFARGEVAVLVGTTVIEVGIDVPNASVMLIEHAERFGLSQLHQLRGRIGRGGGEATCILMVRGKVGQLARERLETVRRTSDGFAIAEADLRLRGPGDLSGTRQWGAPGFRVANVLRDHRLLERARVQAARYADDPAWLAGSQGQALLARFETRYHES